MRTVKQIEDEYKNSLSWFERAFGESTPMLNPRPYECTSCDRIATYDSKYYSREGKVVCWQCYRKPEIDMKVKNILLGIKLQSKLYRYGVGDTITIPIPETEK